jgi:hypothetical protein
MHRDKEQLANKNTRELFIERGSSLPLNVVGTVTTVPHDTKVGVLVYELVKVSVKRSVGRSRSFLPRTNVYP